MVVSIENDEAAATVRAKLNRRLAVTTLAVDLTGVAADGVVDCTAAVAAFATTAHTTPTELVFGPGDYRFSGPVVFDKNKCAVRIMPGARLMYYGPVNAPFITFGVSTTTTTQTFINYGEIRCAVTNDWASLDFVAVRLIRVKNQRIDLGKMVGFTVNLQLYGASTQGLEMNRITLDSYDARYHVNFHVAITQGYINQNVFPFINCQNTAGLPVTVESYAIVYNGAVGATNRSVNQNNITVLSAQLGATANPGVNRCPIWHDNCGGGNTISGGRIEGGLGDVAVKFDASDQSVTENIYRFGLVANGEFDSLVQQTGAAYGNQVIFDAITHVPATVWRSGPLVERAWSPVAGEIAVKGMFLQQTTLSAEVYSAVGKILKDHVRPGTNRALGVYVDTEYFKDFEIVTQTTSVNKGRPAFVCYDEDGAILTSASDGHPHVTMGTLSYSTNYGGSYSPSSSTSNRFHLHVQDHVKKVKVLWIGSPDLRSFQIAGLTSEINPQALNVYGGEVADDSSYATASPATVRGSGYSRQGQIVLNKAGGAGASFGWRCTAAGWNAAARVAGATVLLGEMFEADTGKVYVVKTAGVLDAGAGATGTGAGITDGTAVVDYLGTLATWEAIVAASASQTYAPEFARLANDLALDTASFADVTGLTFAILANATYEFEFVGNLTADAATTGIDVSVNGPASPTSLSFAIKGWTSSTGPYERVYTAYDSDTALSGSPGTAERAYSVKGVVQNGANAGTLAFRAKREAVGSGPTVKAGAWGVLRRIS